MKIERLSENVANQLGVRRWMIVMFALTQVALVLSLFSLILKGDSHRETLVPPVIHNTFWVDDDKVSTEYMVEMAVFLSQLYFNVTPANVDFNHRVVKRYVDPRAFGQLEVEARAYSAKIKKDNAATFFAIASVVPDEAHQKIAVQGLLNTYLGDARTSQVTKTYIFEFGRSGGRTMLKSMTEGRNVMNPFAPETKPKKQEPADDQAE